MQCGERKSAPKRAYQHEDAPIALELAFKRQPKLIEDWLRA
jgi:hypothetical protein